MAGSFSLDLRRFVQRAGANAAAVERKVVLDVGTRIVEKTPVGDPSRWSMPAPAGYVGGRARGAWQYAQGGPVAVEPGTIDGSGQASINRIAAGVAGASGADHYITNSVPYIRRLEYDGWSGQAPEGMVRITIEEYQQIVARAVGDLP